VLLIGPLPPGAGLWWDFSMALGFAAMAMMSMQFALTARFRRATAPFGIDIIYYFHRYVGVIAFGLLLAHVASYASITRKRSARSIRSRRRGT
jgi:predicted ferric reductase